MSRRNVAALAFLGALVAGCHKPAPPVVPAHPHFVLGGAWQGMGQGARTWFYPRADYSYRATGLATRETPPATSLTADGEAWSAQAMTGAHQTLQLPAIVMVRNLANGRVVRIRLNARGPASAGRIVALSPHVADLLGMGRDAPVEIVEDEEASRAEAEALGAVPDMKVERAPVGVVQAESLNDASRQVYGDETPGSGLLAHGAGALPSLVRQGPTGEGSLYVRLGTFSGRAAAQRVAERCGGEVSRVFGASGLDWEARSGPYGDVTHADVVQADMALDRTPSCGVEGARIIVE